MFKIIGLMLSLFVVTTTPDMLNKTKSSVLNTRDNPKQVILYRWQDIIQEPALILLSQCEAGNGKGDINLNAYNPKDTDGKEKFGPFQYDYDTFYLGAERFGLKNPDIASATQQVWMTRKYLNAGEWWRWPYCWNKIFPR